MPGNRTTAAGDTTGSVTSLIPVILYTSLLMLLGSCGNILVCYVYGFRWQRTVTKIFIFSLAALDLTNSLICMPTEIAMLVHIVSFDAPDWCRITRFLTYTLNGSSSLILVSIALDRYYKIRRPLRCFFTERRAKQVCLGAVLIAAALSSPSLVFYGNLTIPITGSDDTGVMCLVSDDYIDTVWPMAFYSVYFTCYLALVVAITVLYSRIAIKLTNLRRKQKERLKIIRPAFRNSKLIVQPVHLPPAQIVIDDNRGLQENDVINRSRENNVSNVIETPEITSGNGIVESGILITNSTQERGTASSANALTENGIMTSSTKDEKTVQVASGNEVCKVEIKSLGALLQEAARDLAESVSELNRLQDGNGRRRSVTFRLPVSLTYSGEDEQVLDDATASVRHQCNIINTGQLHVESRAALNGEEVSKSSRLATQNLRVAARSLMFCQHTTHSFESGITDENSDVSKNDIPSKQSVEGSLMPEAEKTQDDRKQLDSPPPNQDKNTIDSAVKTDCFRNYRNEENKSSEPGTKIDRYLSKGDDFGIKESSPLPGRTKSRKSRKSRKSTKRSNVVEDSDLYPYGELKPELIPHNAELEVPIFSPTDRLPFPVESGLTSRNSFLMPSGGYPGGRTPTSRLPTPSETPNPEAADNRPVRLSSALILDRLSRKMAYRPAKTTRMLFSISLVFVVSFLPFFVIVLLRAAQGRAFLASLSDVEVVIVSIFIRSSFISNAANPFIYGLCNKQFRTECRHLFGRVSGRRSDVAVPRVIEQTDDALAGCAGSK